MKRAILIVFIACGLGGCKSQTPVVDPFFGRTTVPPPGTGSISGQAADPYYQPTPPLQQPPLQQPLQPNASYGYNPGRTTTNPNSPPSYSGSGWTNPSTPPSYSGPTWTNPSNPPSGSTPTNPYNSQQYPQQYPGPASSALTGASPATNSGASTYPLRTVPQNNPTLAQPPAGYYPQTPPAQPASAPSTSPNSTWPGGNRYAPPGGYNYRGTSTEVPSSPPASPSPNRVSTPFFAGGVPNRTSIPVTDNGPRPLDGATGNVAGTVPNTNSYPNVYNPQAAYNPTGIAGGSNSYANGQAPIVRTLQPQPRDKPYSQGNNYFYPASRQSGMPTPAQPQNSSPQPTWRESSSSDTRLIDDNVEAASNIETSDADK